MTKNGFSWLIGVLFVAFLSADTYLVDMSVEIVHWPLFLLNLAMLVFSLIGWSGVVLTVVIAMVTLIERINKQLP